jgi:hypothetical protein
VFEELELDSDEVEILSSIQKAGVEKRKTESASDSPPALMTPPTGSDID